MKDCCMLAYMLAYMLSYICVYVLVFFFAMSSPGDCATACFASLAACCSPGCIPTFIDKYSSVDYQKTFLPWKTKLMEVQWRKGNELPFIWARDVDEFFDLYDELFFTGPAGMAKLDLIQRETMEWWAAAKLHFKEFYKKSLCTVTPPAAEAGPS